METTIDNLILPGIPEKKAEIIKSEFDFDAYKKIAAEWKAKAEALVITDASQLTEMKQAGEGRKFLQKARTTIDKKRKELKENALREGQAIDSVAKALIGLIQPIEEDLATKEKYAELLEKQRQQDLHDERYLEIIEYLEEIPVGVNYGALDNGTWMAILSHAKTEHLERKRLAEEEKKRQDELLHKNNLFNERRLQLAPYQEFGFFDLTIDTNQAEFESYLKEGMDAKADYDKEQENIRLENQRLKDEQEKKDKIRAQRSKELFDYVVFIRDYNGLIDKNQEEYEAELAEIKIAAQQQWDFEASEAIRIKQQQEESDKQVAGLQLQHTREKALFNVDFDPEGLDLASMSDEEFKKLYETHQKIYLEKAAEEKRLAEEQALKQKQEQDAKIALSNATDVVKLENLIQELTQLELPDCSSDKGKKVVTNVRGLIGKINSYLREQIELMS